MNVEAEARIARGREATRSAATALRTMLATTNYSHDEWTVIERAAQLTESFVRAYDFEPAAPPTG